jgi:Hemerythrin HHE cation binding domain
MGARSKEATMTTRRLNIYGAVHKGIRARLAALVEQSGRTDFSRARDIATLQQELTDTFTLLEQHAAKENRFINPLIRSYAPRVAAALDGEHHEQEERMKDLRDRLANVRSGAADAPATGHAFAVALSRFVGELVVHMADEEEKGMVALWEALDDGVLFEVHAAILASIPPDELMHFVTWMLPAMNAPERLELMAGVRTGAPPEGWNAMAELARRVLDPQDWAALERGLAGEVSRAA